MSNDYKTPKTMYSPNKNTALSTFFDEPLANALAVPQSLAISYGTLFKKAWPTFCEKHDLLFYKELILAELKTIINNLSPSGHNAVFVETQLSHRVDLLFALVADKIIYLVEYKGGSSFHDGAKVDGEVDRLIAHKNELLALFPDWTIVPMWVQKEKVLENNSKLAINSGVEWISLAQFAEMCKFSQEQFHSLYSTIWPIDKRKNTEEMIELLEQIIPEQKKIFAATSGEL